MSPNPPLFIAKRSALNLLGDQTIFLGQTNNTIIRFTHTTDFTTDGIGLGTFGHTASFGININDVDLNGSVILGVDYSVGGRAKQHKNTSFVKIHKKLLIQFQQPQKKKFFLLQPQETRVTLTIYGARTNQHSHRRRSPLLSKVYKIHN